MKRHRKKYKRKTGIGLILLMVLSIFCTIRYARAKLDDKHSSLNAQVDALEQQISDENDRTKEIKDLKAYVQTKQYVEDVAREKFGLVYKDEVVIKAEK